MVCLYLFPHFIELQLAQNSKKGHIFAGSGKFFAVFRLNSVLLAKNGAIWRIFWENQPKNRHMRAWFQNLGAVYPIGAKALLTEFGFRNLKGNSQGNGLKTQSKNPSCEGLCYQRPEFILRDGEVSLTLNDLSNNRVVFLQLRDKSRCLVDGYAQSVANLSSSHSVVSVSQYIKDGVL